MRRSAGATRRSTARRAMAVPLGWPTLLTGAPNADSAEALWSYIATPPRLRPELAATPVDFVAVEGVALRLGATAAGPLLDYLRDGIGSDQPGAGPECADRHRSRGAARGRRATRAAPLVRPAEHPRAAPDAAHLAGGLLARSPAPSTPTPQVRREAYKLLLDFPQHRASAMSHGLSDADDGIVQLVLLAALESCPPEAVRAVERFLGDGAGRRSCGRLAVRVAGARERAGGAAPAGRSSPASGAVFRGWRLAAKSPIVLAALGALAQHWAAHPQVGGLLELARAPSRSRTSGCAAQARFA